MPDTWGQRGSQRGLGQRQRGSKALTEEVVRLCEMSSDFKYTYEADASIEENLGIIVTKVYHGDSVVLTFDAKKQAAQLTELGFGNYPICMAKTQYSFSDDPAAVGRAQQLQGHSAQPEGQRRRRLHRGPDRRHYDHAGSPQESLRREDRCGCQRQNFRFVLENQAKRGEKN